MHRSLSAIAQQHCRENPIFKMQIPCSQLSNQSESICPNRDQTRLRVSYQLHVLVVIFHLGYSHLF